MKVGLVLEKDDLADLLAGNLDDAITGSRLPAQGVPCPVRGSQAGPVRCWVELVDSWPHLAGGNVVVLKRVPAPHEPRFLARQAGLLHPPQYAPTTHRAIDELECVPEQWQAELSTGLSERDHLVRLDRAEAARQDRWRSKRGRGTKAA